MGVWAGFGWGSNHGVVGVTEQQPAHVLSGSFLTQTAEEAFGRTGALGGGRLASLWSGGTVLLARMLVQCTAGVCFTHEQDRGHYVLVTSDLPGDGPTRTVPQHLMLQPMEVDAAVWLPYPEMQTVLGGPSAAHVPMTLSRSVAGFAPDGSGKSRSTGHARRLPVRPYSVPVEQFEGIFPNKVSSGIGEGHVYILRHYISRAAAAMRATATQDVRGQLDAGQHMRNGECRSDVGNGPPGPPR